MAEEKKGKSEDDQRYKYIGFDVYPFRPKKFWKDTEEEKRYLEEVSRRKEKGEREERDHSLVFVSVFSPVERLILTVTSILMVVSIFLPWFTFSRDEQAIRYNALQFLFNLGTVMTYSGLGGVLMGVVVFLFLLIILSSFLLGIYSLAILYGKRNSEIDYFKKVKSALRLNLIPFLLWLLVLILSIFGAATPLATAFGVDQLKNSFNVITLVSISGFGLWISLGCWIMNSLKANDL